MRMHAVKLLEPETQKIHSARKDGRVIKVGMVREVWRDRKVQEVRLLLFPQTHGSTLHPGPQKSQKGWKPQVS